MTKPTHAQLMNGTSSSVLLDNYKPYEEKLRFTLNRMNGASFWAYCIWRVQGELDPLNPKTWEAGQGEYIQCAGAADAMTVEMRMLDGDGVAHQFVIGKETAELTGEPTESISWDDGRYSAKVYPHEVFTADEAADIFYKYFLNEDDLSGPYVVREIQL